MVCFTSIFALTHSFRSRARFRFTWERVWFQSSPSPLTLHPQHRLRIQNPNSNIWIPRGVILKIVSLKLVSKHTQNILDYILDMRWKTWFVFASKCTQTSTWTCVYCVAIVLVNVMRIPPRICSNVRFGAHTPWHVRSLLCNYWILWQPDTCAGTLVNNARRFGTNTPLRHYGFRWLTTKLFVTCFIAHHVHLS